MNSRGFVLLVGPSRESSDGRTQKHPKLPSVPQEALEPPEGMVPEVYCLTVLSVGLHKMDHIQNTKK